MQVSTGPLYPTLAEAERAAMRANEGDPIRAWRAAPSFRRPGWWTISRAA
jgi:hypothetical protein